MLPVEYKCWQLKNVISVRINIKRKAVLLLKARHQVHVCAQHVSVGVNGENNGVFSLIVPLYPLQRLSLRVWENVSPNGALSMTFYISLDLHKSDGLQPI